MARIICKEIWEMWSTQVTMYLTKNPTTNARQKDWIYWVGLATYTFYYFSSQLFNFWPQNKILQQDHELKNQILLSERLILYFYFSISRTTPGGLTQTILSWNGMGSTLSQEDKICSCITSGT